MRTLFYLTGFLIAYGSLYPFHFLVPDSLSLGVLFDGPLLRSSLSDLLSNILLFLPFGYLGSLLYPGRLRWIVLSGVSFATALQVAQIFVIGRSPDISDVIWNTVGILLGVALATVSRTPFGRVWVPRGQLPPAPLFLLMSWLGYRLMPFVPSIDWQLFKDSLRPLLLAPQASPLDVFNNTAYWLLAYALLSRGLWPQVTARMALLGTLAVFALEVIIVQNFVSLANLLGAWLALCLWFGILGRARAAFYLLAVVTAMALVARGLAPFQWVTHPNSFNWLPFSGFLHGSMLVNLSALFYKIFVYGGLIWLLEKCGAGLWGATALSAALIGAVEVAQLFLVRHSAEISDPLLVLILAFGFAQLQRAQKSSYIDNRA